MRSGPTRVAGTLLLLALSIGAASARGPDLTHDGVAHAPILVPTGAAAAERTAAEELARYLGRATGARFAIVEEHDPNGAPSVGPVIAVGATATARRNGIACDRGAEGWVVRAVPEGLVLCGGAPRGTLYAVYHFLEEQVGVRWWTPWDEHVPQRPRLPVGRPDLSGRPAFAYRDVHGIGGPRAFCARQRMNGHASHLSWDWGGAERYGPPAPAHTFAAYAPVEQYYATHPEWYSELDGRRTREPAQLCLSQVTLLDHVVDLMDRTIRDAERVAARRGVPPPRLYAFSPNDRGGDCTCDSCRALGARHGGPAAPLATFVSALARRIGAVHPGVLIDTLAYHTTFEPPRDLPALPENVTVRFSALQRRDFTRPLDDPVHREVREALAGWGALTAHLRIWDYGVTFGPDGELPLPNLPVLARDLRYYREQGVEGVFLQLDHALGSDMGDLKLWVLLRLLERPELPVRRLVREFTDGYYGPAGGAIRRYLRELEGAAARRPGRVGYPATLEQHAWLDAAFLRRGARLFDTAEGAVADDPLRLARVRHARVSLDRATLLRPQGLDLPARTAVARRLCETWRHEIERRIPPAEQAHWRRRLSDELRRVGAALDETCGKS